MGKKSSSVYQPIDPSVGEAMKHQAALAKEQQDWYQGEMWPLLRAQTDKQNEWAAEDSKWAREQAQWWRDYTQQQTDKLNQRADEQWSRWQATLPSENALADTARNYNAATEQERQTERALTDITTQSALGRRALGQGMTSRGVDPTSGQYQAGFRQLSENEANSRAQAMLAAEQVAKELGWNKKMQAVGIGQGYLTGSQQYANAANQIAGQGGQAAMGANGLASSLGQLGTQNISGLIGTGLNNYKSLGNAWNQYGQMGINSSNTQFLGAQAQSQANQMASQGIGGAIGMAGMAAATAWANRDRTWNGGGKGTAGASGG